MLQILFLTIFVVKVEYVTSSGTDYTVQWGTEEGDKGALVWVERPDESDKALEDIVAKLGKMSKQVEELKSRGQNKRKEISENPKYTKKRYPAVPASHPSPLAIAKQPVPPVVEYVTPVPKHNYSTSTNSPTVKIRDSKDQVKLVSTYSPQESTYFPLQPVPISKGKSYSSPAPNQTNNAKHHSTPTDAYTSTVNTASQQRISTYSVPKTSYSVPKLTQASSDGPQHVALQPNQLATPSTRYVPPTSTYSAPKVAVKPHISVTYTDSKISYSAPKPEPVSVSAPVPPSRPHYVPATVSKPTYQPAPPSPSLKEPSTHYSLPTATYSIPAVASNPQISPSYSSAPQASYDVSKAQPVPPPASYHTQAPHYVSADPPSPTYQTPASPPKLPVPSAHFSLPKETYSAPKTAVSNSQISVSYSSPHASYAIPKQQSVQTVVSNAVPVPAPSSVNYQTPTNHYVAPPSPPNAIYQESHSRPELQTPSTYYRPPAATYSEPKPVSKAHISVSHPSPEMTYAIPKQHPAQTTAAVSKPAPALAPPVGYQTPAKHYAALPSPPNPAYQSSPSDPKSVYYEASTRRDGYKASWHGATVFRSDFSKPKVEYAPPSPPPPPIYQSSTTYESPPKVQHPPSYNSDHKNVGGDASSKDPQLWLSLVYEDQIKDQQAPAKTYVEKKPSSIYHQQEPKKHSVGISDEDRKSLYEDANQLSEVLKQLEAVLKTSEERDIASTPTKVQSEKTRVGYGHHPAPPQPPAPPPPPFSKAPPTPHQRPKAPEEIYEDEFSLFLKQMFSGYPQLQPEQQVLYEYNTKCFFFRTPDPGSNAQCFRIFTG